MTKKEFDLVYDLFLRTHTNKLKLQPRSRASSWPVTNMTRSGLVYLSTNNGNEYFRFQAMSKPKIMCEFPKATVEELAEMINKGQHARNNRAIS